MNLYVGLKLKTANNDIAEIVTILGDYVRLRYQGNTFTVRKNILNKFNLKEYIEKKETEKHTIIKKIEDIPIRKCCSTCMERRNGNCSSISGNGICEDYRPSPDISKEEIARWPKEADATYFRTHRFARNRN